MRRPTGFDLSELESWSEATLSAVRSALDRTLSVQTDLPVDREDLIGEVLLRLLALDPRQVAKPVAYARRMLKNLIVDKIRHVQRTRQVLEQISRQAESRQDSKSLQVIEDNSTLEHLFRHTELSPVQKQVLELMYYEGKTITEVARKLAKNPGTIHRHHHRAIEKLAACASQMENQHEHLGDAD